MADIKVDYKDVQTLRTEIRAAEVVSLGRLGERLYQLLRAEVPKVTTNLQQGVSIPDVDESKMTVEITVSARSAGINGGDGEIHYPSGKTKPVKIRPTVPYNYAEVVALGNKNATVGPKKAKAMLIPVTATPSDGTYITFGSKIYVVRISRAGRQPNRYDERAAVRLESESPRIVGKVFEELFN